MKISVYWFRRDLRLVDNTALNEALKSGNKVLPVFIFDDNILAELAHDDARFSFIYEKLSGIHKSLNKKGSTIAYYHGNPIDSWKKIVSDYKVDKVFFNKDYEPYARDRDQRVLELLIENNVNVYSFKDQVIFEESEIVKSDEKPYTVFTPYKNKWLDKFNSIHLSRSGVPSFDNFLSINLPFPTMKELGFSPSEIKVRDFNLDHINEYASIRDFPFMDKTSYLSPHLRFGTISIRQLLLAIKNSHPQFVSELIWREFFMQILYHFPHVVHANFKAKYDGVKWENSKEDFKKWCSGKTGYPMVDAGMRQLNESGYMHNRVRMICAGFLCKHLLIDWRWGEAYFAKKLLDYELSSNNGNWQWAAGTGCDAAPYFRIFNPKEQLKKFDKDEKYIKKWVPEHGSNEYPNEMIDHTFARKRALARYKEGIQ